MCIRDRAWTEVGGDILYIESVLTPGKGKVSLTGNLGDVMKESATIAHEWVMAHHAELGIDPALFEKNDINIHVHAGAIPKDEMCIRDRMQVWARARTKP